jgi:hypothetical protein
MVPIGTPKQERDRPHQQSQTQLRQLKAAESNFSISVQNPMWKWINQDIEQLSKAQLHKLTLQFDVKSAEQNYHEYWYLRNLIMFRVGVIINVLLLGLVAEDFVFAKNLSATLELADRIVRFGVLIAFWLFLLVFSFFRPFKFVNQWLISVAIFLTGLAIVILGYYAPVIWYGLVALYLSSFFLITLRFQYALVTTALIQVTFVIIALVNNTVDRIDTVVFLFSVFFTTSGACYYLETYSRKNFLEEQVLHKEQERLRIEQSKSEELLVNLLPVSVAHQLKAAKSGTTANKFDEVSIIFVHIAGTSKLLHEFGLKDMFNYVNKIFCKFDEFTQSYQLEKIKTIGSTYMVAGNLPTPLPNHVHAMINLALDMLRFIAEFSKETGLNFHLRIGLNVGPVVAGNEQGDLCLGAIGISNTISI